MIKVRYIYIDDKITILLNIPVESHRRMDVFKLYKIFSLPIKVNNRFLKLKIDEHDLFQAVGLKYRTSVDKNKCFVKSNQYFCTPSAEFTDYRSDKGCISSILKNNKNLIDRCNINEIKTTGDIFLKISGTYFYSIDGKRRVEIICEDNLHNSYVELMGIGEFRLKDHCLEKAEEILLMGSSVHKLNSTFF